MSSSIPVGIEERMRDLRKDFASLLLVMPHPFISCRQNKALLCLHDSAHLKSEGSSLSKSYNL